MSKKQAYRQPDEATLMSVEKQAVVELDPTTEPVVAQPIVSTPAVLPAKREKQPVYTLLINDQLAVIGEGKVPTGSWYCAFCDLQNGNMHGPYPLLVKTSKGQTVLSGYVTIDNAKSVASMLYQEYSRNNWKEPVSPLFLEDAVHKFMSTVLYVDRTEPKKA
jgi:hypothetical protein